MSLHAAKRGHDGLAGIGRRAVPELTLAVLAPAADRLVGHQGAGEVIAGDDLACALASRVRPRHRSTSAASSATAASSFGGGLNGTSLFLHPAPSARASATTDHFKIRALLRPGPARTGHTRRGETARSRRRPPWSAVSLITRATANGTPCSWQTCATAAPSISTASALGQHRAKRVRRARRTRRTDRPTRRVPRHTRGVVIPSATQPRAVGANRAAAAASLFDSAASAGISAIPSSGISWRGNNGRASRSCWTSRSAITMSPIASCSSTRAGEPGHRPARAAETARAGSRSSSPPRPCRSG